MALVVLGLFEVCQSKRLVIALVACAVVWHITLIGVINQWM